MKILGVKFKNINSLTGEWEIRFDQSPISDTGLFAIVGPNGSGKSSILDAITLGLYGETARLNRPETAIQSLPAKESYAEVTFSVMDHCYCSRWSADRAGDGPVTPDMSLFSLNGEKKLMESRSIPVRNRVAELTGLDFKRFCRSILLAQGEFSAFLHALENERAEILEKIIGPEVLSEMEASIRTQAERETERLYRLKEEAAGFQTPDRVNEDATLQVLDQAREDIHEIDRNLKTLREIEAWIDRMEREPLADQHAAEAIVTAEMQYAQARKHFEQMDQARPAGLYREALTRLEILKARAETIQFQVLHVTSQTPAGEHRLGDLETRLAEIRDECEAVRQRLAERTEDFLGAASLDSEIAAAGEHFLKNVSRLEAIAREQRDTARLQSEQEGTESKLIGLVQYLDEWIAAHAADADLETEMPLLESLLTRIDAHLKEIESYRKLRVDALKAEERSNTTLLHAEAAVLNAQTQADRLKERKTDRDGRLQTLYGNETDDSLKTCIERGIKNRAACKKLVRIARRAAAFKNVPDELVTYHSRVETLTGSITTEQSRLEALEGQIHQRNTIRRFDPDRSLLSPGAPCPLCGASTHPFIESGMLDFTELDGIVREREEKIRALHAEHESLEKKGQALQARSKILDEYRQDWEDLITVSGETWVFGDKISPAERTHAIRKEIRHARSKIRTAWWYVWQAKWTDRRLGRKLEKLSKRRSLLDQALELHQTQQKEAARIDAELNRLDESRNTARMELSRHLDRLQETMPDSGEDNLAVDHLKERLEHYRNKERERIAAADELERLQMQRLTFSEMLQQLAAEADFLSVESETIQTRLNALMADREACYGVLDPARERLELEIRLESLSSEEISISREFDALRVSLAADREAVGRLHDQAQQLRNEVDTAERNLMDQSVTAGFSTLDAIREGLSILESEQDVTRRLAEAGSTLAAARQALADLQPKHPTQDSLDMIRWKISEADKRHKELEKDIEAGERTLEQHRQAESEYRELLQAIAVQEKACAEAMAIQRSIEGKGQPYETLQHLLLKQLLEETNRHLTALSSVRYVLKSASENPLGLHIEDAFQAGALRPVKTLSGGESFLVSLCLALGLSDMASQRRKIESLFIDEGFGALDDEMLYKVMSALKNLRADGKTVGIVSHVKRLAQEIPTQIRLEKMPGGFSRITVVA
jgi:exonuclease SbcC